MKIMMLRRKKALNKAFSLIMSTLMLVLCAGIISTNLNGVGGIGIAHAQNQAQDQNVAQDQGDDLGTYTPPPMFEGKTKPLNTDDLTILNGGVVKKPTPKSLLGFAEESPDFERVIGTKLPVPKRKPVQQVAVQTIEAIPPEITQELETATPEIKASSSDKIINEDSVTLLPDDHREALVDLLFVPDDESRSQDLTGIPEEIQEDVTKDVAQAADQEIAGQEIVDQEKVEDQPDPPLLAQSRPAISDLGFRRPQNSLVNSDTSSLQYYGLLTPPQDILDDVIAPAVALPSSANITAISNVTKAADDSKLASYPPATPPATPSNSPSTSPSTSPSASSQSILRADKPENDSIKPDRQITVIDDDGDEGLTTLTRAQDVARRLDIIKPNRAQENQAQNLNLTKPVAARSGDDQLVAIRLPFREGETDLGVTHKAYMDEYVPNILRQVLARKIPRVEIKAFADYSNQSESDMRRLSLARALAVREYLLSLGIESSQMNVRALGPDQAHDQSSLSIVNTDSNAWPKNDWVDIEIK